MYLQNGIKIHVRKTKALFKTSDNDKRLTIRPSLDQMRNLNIEHYRGKQYKYIRFLCSKTEKKRLIKNCIVPLNLPKPKDSDLSWKRKDLLTGQWIDSGKPLYKTDQSEDLVKEKKKIKQLSIYDIMEE